MRELLEFILKSILGSEDDFSVSEEEILEGVRFIVQVPTDQIGIIIGQGGKTIKAIRNLLSASSKGKKFFIEVVEKE